MGHGRVGGGRVWRERSSSVVAVGSARAPSGAAGEAWGAAEQRGTTPEVELGHDVNSELEIGRNGRGYDTGCLWRLFLVPLQGQFYHLVGPVVGTLRLETGDMFTEHCQ